MAKKSNGGSKSDEIRQLLIEQPTIRAKEAVAKLAEKGITIAPGLFYFVKGHAKGKKARRKRSHTAIARLAEPARSSRADVVSLVLKVKALAMEMGGLKNLKELVEVLSD